LIVGIQEEDPDMINSVLKAIKILRLFSHNRPFLSLNEISTQLGYPKTTIHALLNTLESQGFIEKAGKGLYSLGTAVIPLTQNVRVNIQIRDRAAPFLRTLFDHFGESVYLTVLDGDYCLYIYAIESSHRLLARSAIGERINLHCTSVGKAILAYLPKEDVAIIIERVGLPQCTANTITDVDRLYKELEVTRQRGFSIDSSEHEENTFCVGAPIFDGYAKIMGSCSVSGIDPEIISSRLASIAVAVRYTAQEISRLMGLVPIQSHLIQNPFV
jgi:DNA-binding IclR family transcriptional regulator